MGLAMVPFDAEKIKIKLLYRSEKLEEWNNIFIKSGKSDSRIAHKRALW